MSRCAGLGSCLPSWGCPHIQVSRATGTNRHWLFVVERIPGIMWGPMETEVQSRGEAGHSHKTHRRLSLRPLFAKGPLLAGSSWTARYVGPLRVPYARGWAGVLLGPCPPWRRGSHFGRRPSEQSFSVALRREPSDPNARQGARTISGRFLKAPRSSMGSFQVASDPALSQAGSNSWGHSTGPTDRNPCWPEPLL